MATAEEEWPWSDESEEAEPQHWTQQEEERRAFAQRGPWTKRKAMADRYAAAIRSIVRTTGGEILMTEEASVQMDREQATDYITASGRIATRLRLECPYRDWTIRTSGGRNGLSERDKLLRGDVRWYIYAWATQAQGIVEFIVVDVERVVKVGTLLFAYKEKRNDTGETWIPIKLKDLERYGCIARHWKLKPPSLWRQ